MVWERPPNKDWVTGLLFAILLGIILARQFWIEHKLWELLKLCGSQ